MTERALVVVDTNILFSALLRRDSSFAQTIFASERDFFICESVVVELFNHKERIVRLSKLSDSEIVRLYYLLLRHITVAREELITPKHRLAAYEMCRDVDPADTPHVALTMHLQGLLWTGDTSLKAHLSTKGFDRFFEMGK